MLRKLNKETPPGALKSECDFTQEKSDNNEQQDIDLLKQRVANYKKVMTQNFQVPTDVFFSTVPVNIGHLLSFVSKNWKDLAAVRLYFVKKSVNPDECDYEVLFVPCKEIVDEDGESKHYEDMLGLEAECERHIISMACRRPPGCTLGALLME